MALSYNTELSDEQLCILVKEGDKDAFTQVYYKYHRMLYALSYRYLMDADKAEDAVQYVFVRLWEIRSDLDICNSLKNFLFTMTKNYILNVIRNENLALVKNYELAQQVSEFEDDLIEKMENLEKMNLVYEALDKLPKQKKEICLLKFNDKLTNQEIANQLHLSINTIKTHYSESLKILRQQLKKILILIIIIILFN